MTIIRGMGRVGNKPGTAQSGPTYATTFAVSLSASNGTVGTTQTATISPVGGSWPINQAIALSTSGVACSISPDSRTGSGTTPVTFSFTPSAAGSLSVNAIAAGMTSMGAQSYTATAVVVLPPAGTANRFDVMFGVSAAGGTPVSISIAPNGNWPSTGGNITLTSSLGDAVLNVALPTSGSAMLSSSYTPTMSGEVSLTATNNAGLYNPYPAPLTVFATSSGTAQSLSASLPRLDMVTYQRDTASGAPAGFGSQWTKGWGEVWISVGAIGGATGGLFVKLYDALSSGATATAGTGTQLTSGAVQVYGSISAAGTYRVLLPASASIYYADVATDAAFTNPVRIANRFRVGVVLGMFSRSFECGLAREWNDPSTRFTPFYAKTASWVSSDHRYAAGGANWFLQDGVGTNTYQYEQGEHATTAAQEFGRLIEAQLGVCVGITGCAEAGGDFDGCVAHDGSLSDGFNGTVSTSVGNKFRYFWGAHSGWTGDSTYPSETHAEVRTRLFAAVDKIARGYPACAVIGWTQGASGQFGSDGSRATGYTRNTMIILNEIEPTNPMVIGKESYLWNEYVGGHASMAARLDYTRPSFRKLMAAEVAVMGGFQTSARGPKLGASGTLNAGARTITIPFTMAAGTNLVAVGVTYANPNATYNTATSAEIASLFSVYLTGLAHDTGKAVKIDTATVDNAAKTVTLTLSGSTGIIFADNTTAAMPSGFWVDYAADFSASNGTVQTGSQRGIMLADDRIDLGIPYGWHMLPALDIAVS